MYEHTQSRSTALTLGMLGMVAAALYVFGRLRVTVTTDAVEAAFGAGWPRRRVPLGEVTAARLVRNSPLAGFGVRKVADGWMFNVSGLDAVELRLISGAVFRIGTDDAPGLLAAVEEARGRHS